MTTKKHLIKVVLLWENLIIDIEDRARRMARLSKLGVDVALNEGNSSLGETVATETGLEAEDSRILRREMRTGLAELIGIMDKYVWTNKHESTNRNLSEDNIVINLIMPLNWNLAGCECLSDEIHAYIVARALSAWFGLTMVSDKQIAAQAEQKAQMEHARKEIHRIMASRTRMLRERQSLEVFVGAKTYSYYYMFSGETVLSIPEGDKAGTDSTIIAVDDANFNKYIVFGVAAGKEENAVVQENRLGGMTIPPALNPIGEDERDGVIYTWYCSTNRMRYGNAYFVKGSSVTIVPTTQGETDQIINNQ